MLDARVSRVVAENLLASYRSIVDVPLHRNMPQAAIPGVLREYDVPDLLGALSPGSATVVNPLDAGAWPCRTPRSAPAWPLIRASRSALAGVGGSFLGSEWGITGNGPLAMVALRRVCRWLPLDRNMLEAAIPGVLREYDIADLIAPLPHRGKSVGRNACVGANKSVAIRTPLGVNGE